MTDLQSDIATIVLSREELEKVHGRMIYVDGGDDYDDYADTQNHTGGARDSAARTRGDSWLT